MCITENAKQLYIRYVNKILKLPAMNKVIYVDQKNGRGTSALFMLLTNFFKCFMLHLLLFRLKRASRNKPLSNETVSQNVSI